MRVHRERPGELSGVVDGTGQRILAEIGRLDAIARAFSRFALPSAAAAPLEAVDAAEAVREVIGLYRLGEAPIVWEVDARAGVMVRARRDEFVEVLVNLFENARDAAAKRVVVTVGGAAAADSGEPPGQAAVIEVADDGRGIAAALLPRVFEPRFSTTTSGSGLGLAIARRLVEGWGGTIGIASAEGAGTTVTLRLAGPARPAPASGGP
jgi:signal transduction histidine kinase